MSEMYMLIGLPASGKSTWISNFLKNKNDEFVVISSDLIIEEISHEQGKTYDDVFSQYSKYANQEMWRRAEKAFSEGKNIIWDQTNLTVKSRKKKVQKALDSNYKVYAYVFSVDQGTLNHRLKNRSYNEGKSIPERVIKNMANSFTNPSEDEGFNKIVFVNQ